MPSLEIIDNLFNTTNIRTFKVINNYKGEISKRSTFAKVVLVLATKDRFLRLKLEKETYLTTFLSPCRILE